MIVPQLLKVTDGLYYFESRTVSPFAVSGVYLIVRSEVALIEDSGRCNLKRMKCFGFA